MAEPISRAGGSLVSQSRPGAGLEEAEAERPEEEWVRDGLGAARARGRPGPGAGAGAGLGLGLGPGAGVLQEQEKVSPRADGAGWRDVETS